jgi:hypothetical protein
MPTYHNSYRGAGRATTTNNTQPGMEVVLNKQEVIYTDQDNRHVLVIRIQTNKRVYWMYNNEILETTDGFEEMYRIVNRDSKIDTILSNELG